MLQAREANKEQVRKGVETQVKIYNAKKLITLLNFYQISCGVRKDSLELRFEMNEKKRAEEMEGMKRKNKKVSDWK